MDIFYGEELIESSFDFKETDPYNENFELFGFEN